MKPTDVIEPLLERLVLELSLKPFYRADAGTFEQTAAEIMRTWTDLAGAAEELAVLLWIGDGSEILEWKGNKDEPIRWGHTIGFNNLEYGLYPGAKYYALQRAVEFREPVPAVRYRDVAEIVRALRDTADRVLGKRLFVGATIDPGPEFVHNPWKYERHRELIHGGPESDMPESVAFLCSYERLHGDDTAYAGYPEGVPEGTPLGRFLGRQLRSFADALGFDYLWLSNGFGCTHTAWSYMGEAFDGERFLPERAAESKRKLLSFWEHFRAECPGFPVELRGTNFSVGMDAASDGVPLRDIVAQAGALPPNTPWGCRQLGAEMAIYLSRLAGAREVPIPFRYYTNDPWFNSDPWWSYYGREPYDIYCPASACRVEADGRIRNPSRLELLTIDDELGRLVPELAREVTPHLIRAFTLRPDAPGPFVWIYPFDEYHDLIDERPDLLNHPFFHDWFMVACLSAGLPVNTVMAAEDFVRLEQKQEVLRGCVLIAPVPLRDWALGDALSDWVSAGGRALLYGPVGTAAPRAAELLGLQASDPLDGELAAEGYLTGEQYDTPPQRTLLHNSLVSAGGIRATLSQPDDASTGTRLTVRRDDAERVYALVRSAPEWNGGRVAWIRGSVAFSSRRRLEPLPHEPERHHNPGEWSRGLLADLGYVIEQQRLDPTIRPAMLFLSRHKGAFMLAGHKPDAPVTVRLRFPDGAPLVSERETVHRDGCSTYCFDKTIHHEIRAFARQEAPSCIRVKEQKTPTDRHRCFEVSGLQDAEVTLYPYPESLADGSFTVVQTGVYDTGEPTAEDPEGPLVPHRVDYEADKERGAAVLRAVSGSITVTW